MPNRNREEPSQNTPALVDMNARLDKPKEMESLLLAREELPALLEDAQLTPARFIGTVTQALAEAPPEVRNAPRGELLLAVLKAARMGLEPTGAYGGGYLVKLRSNPVDFWVDWRGYIKMAMRSGQLRKADPFVVFEADEFDYLLGDEQHIHHRPFIGTDEQRGKPIYVYAILELTNGAKVREVMSWDEVMAIMRSAPSKTVWTAHPHEQARKTVIRRVFKRVPAVITPQLAYALSEEDKLWEAGENTISVSPVPGQGARRERILTRAIGGSSSNGDSDGSPLEESGASDSPEASAEDAERAKATESDEGIPE